MVQNSSKEEMLKIKKENPLSASSHDLLGSCLTILVGVFGKWQSGKEGKDAKGNEIMLLGIWQRGNGPEAFANYWGALLPEMLNKERIVKFYSSSHHEMSTAAQELVPKTMSEWTHADLMEAVEKIQVKEKSRGRLRVALESDENVDINGKVLACCKVEPIYALLYPLES
jgi:hypothetical protein